ncbi:MAG: hypothetical protein GY793_08160, partial [Proteobacteria bacterium]|nr:hypothetical protein [Pseudomonadota bacterium]
TLNLSFTAAEKKVWLFKLLFLPLLVSLTYFITWNITGDIKTATIITFIMLFFAIAIAIAFAGAGAIAFAFAFACALAIAGAIAFAFAGADAIEIAFASAFAIAIAIAGANEIIKKKYKISLSSNILSAIFQFSITWGMMYIAQHLKIIFVWIQ